jgi:hypothetical protein
VFRLVLDAVLVFRTAATLVAAVLVLGGCDIVGLLAIGNAAFTETVVDNQSDVGYVAQIDDYDFDGSHQFVPIPPRALTAIDSEGEMNSTTTHVWLWDRSCSVKTEVTGGFSTGGTITVAADGGITFVRDRTDRITPTELDSGRSSCEEAVADLP